MSCNNVSGERQVSSVVQLFQAAAILPAAPVSVRQLEIRHTETGQVAYIALTLLRALATGEPSALHATIPGGRSAPPHCFFLGDWTNTFVDLGETTTFFVEPEVDFRPLIQGVDRYVQGDCSSDSVPQLNPGHHAVWVYRDPDESLADASLYTRMEAPRHD